MPDQDLCDRDPDGYRDRMKYLSNISTVPGRRRITGFRDAIFREISNEVSRELSYTAYTVHRDTAMEVCKTAKILQNLRIFALLCKFVRIPRTGLCGNRKKILSGRLA
jgi:hypothetical protein